MDLVKKYIKLSEAWPGSAEWKKKNDPSYNPYDPEGKMRKALKQQPYGYRGKSAEGEEEEKPAEQPAMKKRGRPKKMKESKYENEMDDDMDDDDEYEDDDDKECDDKEMKRRRRMRMMGMKENKTVIETYTSQDLRALRNTRMQLAARAKREGSHTRAQKHMKQAERFDQRIMDVNKKMSEALEDDLLKAAKKVVPTATVSRSMKSPKPSVKPGKKYGDVVPSTAGGIKDYPLGGYDPKTKRSYSEETEIDEGIGSAIAGGIGQFIGNKIDPLHGEILRTHGAAAGRAAEYTIRKHVHLMRKALQKHLKSGKSETNEEVEITKEANESLPASKALQRAQDAQRKKMGLPDPDYYLKLAAQKKKEIEDLKKEEVEQIDELKKSTLASYAKKASRDARMKTDIAGEFSARKDRAKKLQNKVASERLADYYRGKARKREAGVNKAIDRLAKEEKEMPPFEPQKRKQSAVAGKYGAGYSTARHLARQAMQSAIKDLKKGPEAGKKQVS